MYKKTIKRALQVSNSYPDAFLHAPLGSWQGGIKPFYSYVEANRAATLVRLTQGEIQVKRAAHALLRRRPKQKILTAGSKLTCQFPVTIPKDSDPLKHLKRRTKLRIQGKVHTIRHHALPDKSCVLQLCSENDEIFLRFELPWSIDGKPAREGLSAYIIAQRLKLQFGLTNAVFETSKFNTSVLSYRHRRIIQALRAPNADLLLEIHNALQAAPLHVRLVEYQPLFPTQHETLKTEGLTVVHPPQGITTVQWRTSIAESTWKRYLHERDTNPRNRNDANWTKMDWPSLQQVWLHPWTKSLNYLRHICILMEKEFSGGNKAFFGMRRTKSEEPNTFWEDQLLIEPESPTITPTTNVDHLLGNTMLETETVDLEEAEILEEKEEKEDEISEEKEEKKQEEPSPFGCPCGAPIESMEHWTFECPLNTTHIEELLVPHIKTHYPPQNATENPVAKAKEIAQLIKAERNKRKKARALHGNLHQINPPTMSPKEKNIRLKSLRDLRANLFFLKTLKIMKMKT